MPVSPTKPKMPPLKALRAFEAAARNGGITAAASELNVTPGAIAQQVKILEDWVGGKLFERLPQGVILTDIGKASLEDITKAFDQLSAAAHQMRYLSQPDHVQIAALPSIAQLWLSPRLPLLRTKNPQMRISVTAMEGPPNFVREAFDLAIFFDDQLDGELCTVIDEDVIFPVCSPRILKNLEAVEDLKNQNCIGDANWTNDWQIWLSSVGQAEVALPPLQLFSLYNLAMEEARNGAGVAIGHECLVRPYLEEGSLVRPFEGSASTGRHLVAQVNGSAAFRTAKLQAILAQLIDA